jgi:glyoxylase-like metal-dependent hydrolase (beta-lactamase superfamily II)
MNRRSFLKNTTLTAGLLSLGSKELFAALLQQPAYQLTSLRNDVGIFTEKGGTIAYYLSKDGIIVVDTEFPDPAQHLIAELKNQNNKPFKLLINTHHHGDHTGGNIAFKGLVEHVIGQENCLSNYKRVAAEQKSEEKQLFQDITFKTEWKTKLGKEKIKAYYFGPAHTNGDAIIHFEHANIAHLGDLMFNKVYPFIDKKAGASFKNWITVLDKTIATFSDDTLFIFGHGSKNQVTGGKEDLKGMTNYIEQLLSLVDKQIKAGKSKEEILQITSIPNAGQWNDEFKQLKSNLDAAYSELV